MSQASDKRSATGAGVVVTGRGHGTTTKARAMPVLQVFDFIASHGVCQSWKGRKCRVVTTDLA